jgi:hypothetical protein
MVAARCECRTDEGWPLVRADRLDGFILRLQEIFSCDSARGW